MPRSRPLLSVAALLALAGWANAQAMVCCWLPDALASVRTEAVEVAEPAEPMAADHSCCPGSRDAAPAPSGESGQPGAAMPGCGMDANGVAAPCCEIGASGETAAISAPVTITELLPDLAGLPAIPYAAVTAAESPPSPVPFFSRTGSPPYLSFQRLLI